MRALRHLPRMGVLLLVGVAACDQPTAGNRATAHPGGGTAPLLTVAENAIPGRYVVAFHPGAQGAAVSASAREMVSAHGGRLHYTYQHGFVGFAASLSDQAVEALRRDPQVRYVAQDGWAEMTQTTQPGATWGLDRIDQRDLPLGTSYVYGPTGAGVRVYVIDSGILTSHDEFGGRASVGADYVGDGQNGQDCNGHGTHVAGTIAGTTYGVAKAAQVVSVRVFGCTGGAPYSTVIAAVDWVTANAVEPAVANMSLGGGFYAPMNEAVQASIASGVVYALAAGNDAIDACTRSPASTPEAITVGSTESYDVRSWFSNWGTCVDLFAPGSSITSAWWTSTTATHTISGTSMAAPHVAGVAALYLQGNPTATPAVVAEQVLASTTGNRLGDVGTGSPNLLLFSGLTAEPPAPLIGLTPSFLHFSFVRPEPGAAALSAPADTSVRPRFTASGAGEAKVFATSTAKAEVATSTSEASARVVLSNPGTGTLNWTTMSNRGWLGVGPAEGALNAGYTANLRATVDAASLAEGTYSGAFAVLDPAANNSGAEVTVTVLVAAAQNLYPGTPRTGLSGAYESRKYYMVTVPEEATSLTITTTGGSGDADLYVRYGQLPTSSEFDCRPYMGGNEEQCVADAPLDGVYYVMVHGWSSYSDMTLSATTGGPPAAPSGLGATVASATLVNLAWTDGSVNESSFRLARRHQDGSGTWSSWQAIGTTAANTTSHADSTATAGRTYQYMIRACNISGCSAWKASATVATPGVASPSGVVATVKSGSWVQLTWTENANNETGYVVERRMRNADLTWGPFQEVVAPPANATVANDYGVTGENVYYYRVRACQNDTCSAAGLSNWVTVPVPPAAPTGFTGTMLSATRVGLAWTDASTNESSFAIQRSKRNPDLTWGAWAEIAAPGVNSKGYQDATVSAGSYHYRIRACNVAGCSVWASVFVRVDDIPPAPTSPTAAPLSSTSIQVGWTDQSLTETHFEVQRQLQNADLTWTYWGWLPNAPADATGTTDSGLLSGRTYRYRVRACTAEGCSAWATGPAATTPAS